MKPLSLLFIFIAFSCCALVAQDSTLKKRLSFKIWITGIDSSKTIGWLSAISDSSLELSNRPKHFNDPLVKANNHLIHFDYSQLAAMKLKRNNGAGRGAAIGAASGLVIGAIAGFSAGDDPHVPASQDLWGIGEAFRMTAADKALVGGFAGAAIGAGLGALTGALVKKTFIIEGKKEKFDEMRLNIIERAYRK